MGALIFWNRYHRNKDEQIEACTKNMDVKYNTNSIYLYTTFVIFVLYNEIYICITAFKTDGDINERQFERSEIIDNLFVK